MVPDGWQRKKIIDIAETVTSGARDWARFYSDSGSKFIRMTNLSRGDIKLKLNDLKYVSISNQSTEGKRTSLKSGDILMSITAELGKIGLVPESLGHAYINQHTALIRLKKEKADPRFVAYLLSTPWMNNKINRLNDAGAKAALNLPSVKSIGLALPRLVEQQKIAKILSTWDEAIATTEQLLANSEQQKKALMQQLLTGKKRLPGFQGEWEEVALGRLFSERKETGIAGLSLLSVTSGQGVIKRDDVGRKDTSSADKSRYLRVCPGDIAYNTMRMWQGVSALSGLEGIVSPAYTVLKPESAVDSRFAAHLFKLPRMVHRFYRHSQGLVSDTWNLKYKQFARIKVLVPGVKEQMAIADVLCKEDETISCLEEKLGFLAGEKKALMQQLLTGKRRVKVDEAERATA